LCIPILVRVLHRNIETSGERKKGKEIKVPIKVEVETEIEGIGSQIMEVVKYKIFRVDQLSGGPGKS
jgi:hypothetical protein